MKKNRGRRLFMLLIVLMLAMSGSFWLFGFPGGMVDKAAETEAGQAGSTGSLPGQRVASRLPARPVFAHMSAAERQQVIAQARQDAEIAARASGQTEAQAAMAGQAAEAAAQRAFARSSSLGGKP